MPITKLALTQQLSLLHQSVHIDNGPDTLRILQIIDVKNKSASHNHRRYVSQHCKLYSQTSTVKTQDRTNNCRLRQH